MLACDTPHQMNVRGAKTVAALYCCKLSNVDNWQTQLWQTADRKAVTALFAEEQVVMYNIGLAWHGTHTAHLNNVIGRGRGRSLS